MPTLLNTTRIIHFTKQRQLTIFFYKSYASWRQRKSRVNDTACKMYQNDRFLSLNPRPDVSRILCCFCQIYDSGLIRKIHVSLDLSVV